MTKRIKKEVAFSAKQIEQLHIVLETHEADQASQHHLDWRKLKWEQHKPSIGVPRFKRIEEYTDDELKAAIERASKQWGNTMFWSLLNGIDAFLENRRRQRGWGLSATTRATPPTWR